MTDAAAATPAKKGRKPKDGAKKKSSKPSHPPTLEMVLKAIDAEKDPKGVSVMAIKKYIAAHYKVTPNMLNHMLRRAFGAGLSGGKLTRPKGQGDSHLLAGRYRLAAGKEKATAAKPKKATKSPAKKPAAKKAKTPKKPAAKKAKKPAAKKSPKKAAVKKSPKKAAKKASPKKKTPKKAGKK